MDGNLKGKSRANGILINSRKLVTHDLQNSDEIVFGPQVRAIYYLLDKESVASSPADEFDITLISPSMMSDDKQADC